MKTRLKRCRPDDYLKQLEVAYEVILARAEGDRDWVVDLVLHRLSEEIHAVKVMRTA